MRARIISTLTMKGLFVGWKQIVLLYAIFPLSICFVMSYFSKGVYKVEENKVGITIVDKDNSKVSHDFKDIFNRKDMRRFFKLSKKGDYSITLKKGKNKNSLYVVVDEKKQVSEHNKELIKSVIKNYNEEVKSKDIFNIEIIQTKSVNNEKSISSYESEAATIITYIMIIMIMSCSKAHYLEKENGMFKRMMSMPLTKINIFNYYILIYFVYGFCLGMLYIAAFMIAKFAFFNINFINLIVLLIGQSLIVASASGFFIVFLKKNSANVILTTLLLIETCLGGGFIPKVKANTVFIGFMKFEPLKFVSEAYKNIITYNSLGNIEKNLIIMVVVSFVLYIISLAKVKVSWEE
ncbi:ABC-2 type transport system permease protein [Clostridium acetobutylicum]|uniref:Permease, ortholog yfkN B.subtilis n=1 Tax=Clostridium acetobutylicum (strain ATCC 824 / DSM 792 / JCM 1419 / IAM 19013 / LMG 5710 / NBRC 13948 / NRRL B-527 / VKM B-1787 / 2291 / W) TaxID=272562 RepID=Q97KQ0_CLOAB|nr:MULTISPECIES: ABC transporter permease [Clostridium]AAK78843.1 Putative permease, ortholog yfkN B.subtilis [Clostridium acetobutylicum ATCC 824]ADZ19918.1 Putative permease [Clostridium acetobutylicum EA 2018]AEI31479.1 putative permease [Clostridium acetobutylicum DSM 1731]AWV80562.1 ABC transporter permease [Clostridium acetobutylicum]MBC2392752.1 ABC transporter permease [Clostridium acetobutylicum]